MLKIPPFCPFLNLSVFHPLLILIEYNQKKEQKKINPFLELNLLHQMDFC